MKYIAIPEVFGQHTTSSGLRRSAVTKEPSARTEAQDSRPEVMEARTRACVEQQTRHLCFLVAVYCVYKW